MVAAEQRSTLSVLSALLWAIVGSAMIGSTGLAGMMVIEGAAYGIYENPWLALLMPVAFAGPSLVVVIPCTLIFGIPSVMAINHLGLGRWPALAVCIFAATITQIACIRLVFWDDYSKPEVYLFTAPFALGAAVVLWWRLTRSPNYPSDHPQSR